MGLDSGLDSGLDLTPGYEINFPTFSYSAIHFTPFSHILPVISTGPTSESIPRY